MRWALFPASVALALAAFAVRVDRRAAFAESVSPRSTEPPNASSLPPLQPTGGAQEVALDADDSDDGDQPVVAPAASGRTERPGQSIYLPEYFTWGGLSELPDERYALFSRPSSRLRVAGWLQQSFTWNPQNPPDGINGTVIPNDQANEYQLNEFYVSVERRLDRSQEQFQIGSRVDLLYGTSAFLYESSGLDDQIVTSSANGFYQMAIPQAYLSAYLPALRGVTLQAGHFYSLVGYEFLPPQNFFLSLADYNLTIPFTNSGGLATLQLSDRLATQHGITRGWDIWNDPNNNRLSYTGSVLWFDADRKARCSVSWIVGQQQPLLPRADAIGGLFGRGPPPVPGGVSPAGAVGRSIVTLFWEQQLRQKLSYILVAGVGRQDASQQAALPAASWGWITNYLIYDLNERWAAGVRAGWLRDGRGLFLTDDRQLTRSSAGSLYELTVGLNWRPTSNIRLRPELRWDWQQENARPLFDNGTARHQFLAAFDLLLLF